MNKDSVPRIYKCPTHGAVWTYLGPEDHLCVYCLEDEKRAND